VLVHIEKGGMLVLDSTHIAEGTEVEVRNRFTGEWSVGFEVVTVLHGTFQVRRLRDRAILPVSFGDREVRLCTRTSRSSLPGGGGGRREVSSGG
jgi:hypothetical protein